MTNNTATQTCGEALVKLLENYGVETVFGIPGVHTIELYRGLSNTPIRHITPRHEQGAGYGADGYARATGKPGVCFVITGPGITNIITAMAQAKQDSVPMLVISSVNRQYQLGMGEGYLHELPNQQAATEPVCVFSHQLRTPEQLPKVLARAFSVFSSQRPGPVHIEIPMDVIAMPAKDMDLTPYPLPSPPAPAPQAILEAADKLLAAKKTLITIGGGAVKAGESIKVLAERLNAPVINTVNAKGVLSIEHPLSVGASGSCPAVRQALQAADVILAVGTELAETDYDFFFDGEIKINGELIRIDIDANQLARNVKPTMAICSDAKLALEALIKHIPEQKTNTETQRAQAIKQAARQTASAEYDAFFAALSQTLPNAVIVGDSTQPVYYAWLHYEAKQPRSYFHAASGYGTLGYAIPAAIGAKLGQPNRPVISLIGDGAAQFSIGELATATEAGLSVIFLIWNNSGYGEIRRFMDDEGVPRVGVDIFTPNFQQLAQAFGCNYSRPQNLDALKLALKAAKDCKQSSVIEVMENDFVSDYPFP